MMKTGTAANRARNDVRSAEVRPAREMKWTPIEDLPAEANEWIGQDYLAERTRWPRSKRRPAGPGTGQEHPRSLDGERHRLSAIETGQIENLYTMRLGMTEMLIAEGLENARSSHTIEDVLDDQTLQGLLRDQRDAMEMVFRTVKDERPLSESVIKEWHALLTRHQGHRTGDRPAWAARRDPVSERGLQTTPEQPEDRRTARCTSTAPRSTPRVKWSDW